MSKTINSTYGNGRQPKSKSYQWTIDGERVPLDLGKMPQEPPNNMTAHHKDWHGTPAKGKSRSEMIKYLPLPDKPKESRLRRLPHEEEKLEALIEAFILWAHSDDAWDIDEFPVQYGLAPYYFRHHQGSEFWHQCFDLAKTLIALRLKKRMRDFNFNLYFSKMLPLLDNNYAEYEKSLRKDEKSLSNGKTRVLIVEADHIPDSALVKDFIPKDKENDGD